MNHPLVMYDLAKLKIAEDLRQAERDRLIRRAVPRATEPPVRHVRTDRPRRHRRRGRLTASTAADRRGSSRSPGPASPPPPAARVLSC